MFTLLVRQGRNHATGRESITIGVYITVRLPALEAGAGELLILVHRNDQFPAASLLQPLAVPGGHDHAALRVESELVGAPEHVGWAP